jgi:hypothetical protein
MNEDEDKANEVQPTAKRLRISLEPIDAPRIDCIYPDGSVLELPPTYSDPAVLFARQVHFTAMALCIATTQG